MTLKKINLNRALILPTIEAYVGESTNITFIEKAVGFHIYSFLQTGKDQASLNVYYNSNGTTTLQYKTGKNQDWSLEIAQDIVANCSVKEFNANSFYLKAIRDEDFEVVLEFLVQECGAVITSDKEQKNGRHLKLQGSQGDTMVINHFKNKAFQAQGKPRMLFHDTIMILSDLLPFKDIINTQLEFYETNLTSADIIGELENRLPVSGASLDDKIKSVISPSLALRKTDIALTDYSAFAFPMLRGLEGVMKQIFSSKGVNVTKEGFGAFFDNNGISVTFKTSTKALIKCAKHEKALCDMYSYYSNQRHTIFHMDTTVSTSKILDRTEAEHIINTGINVIESGYTVLSS
jgi:hypothetical protein